MNYNKKPAPLTPSLKGYFKFLKEIKLNQDEMGIFPQNIISDVPVSISSSVDVKELIKEELLMQNSNGNLVIETEASVLGDKSM